MVISAALHRLRGASAVALLLCTCSPVVAADWEQVGSAAGVAYEVDFDGLNHYIGAYWRAWVRTDTKFADLPQKHASAKYLYEVNCDTATMRRLSAVTYDATGNVLTSVRSPESEHEPVVPDSIGEAIKREVCLAALSKGFGEWTKQQRGQR